MKESTRAAAVSAIHSLTYIVSLPEEAEIHRQCADAANLLAERFHLPHRCHLPRTATMEDRTMYIYNEIRSDTEHGLVDEAHRLGGRLAHVIHDGKAFVGFLEKDVVVTHNRPYWCILCGHVFKEGELFHGESHENRAVCMRCAPKQEGSPSTEQVLTEQAKKTPGLDVTSGVAIITHPAPKCET